MEDREVIEKGATAHEQPPGRANAEMHVNLGHISCLRLLLVDGQRLQTHLGFTSSSAVAATERRSIVSQLGCLRWAMV